MKKNYKESHHDSTGIVPFATARRRPSENLSDLSVSG